MTVRQATDDASFVTQLAACVAGDVLELTTTGTFTHLTVPSTTASPITIRGQTRAATIASIKVQKPGITFQDFTIQMNWNPAVDGQVKSYMFEYATGNLGGTVLDNLKIRSGYGPDSWADLDPTNAGNKYIAEIGDGATSNWPVTNGFYVYTTGFRNTSSYATGDLTIQNCDFEDNGTQLVLLLAGGGTYKIRNNNFRRSYADSILVCFPGGSFTPIQLLDITGNLFENSGWCQPQDPENPHADLFQIFSADTGSGDSTTPITNLVLAGNIAYYGENYRGQPQRVFLSDVPLGYPFVAPLVVDNLLLSRISDKGVCLNNEGTRGSAYAYVYRNTVLTIPTRNTARQNELYANPNTGKPASTVNASTFDVVNDPNYAGKNFIGHNIGERMIYRAEVDASHTPNLILPTGASASSYNTGFNQPADWSVIDTDSEVISTFTPKSAYADYGAVRSGDTISTFRARWSTDSKPYTDLPSYVGIRDKLDQALNTLVTSEWGYIHAGKTTRTITPGSGVEWRSADDTSGTNATSWSSSTGSVTDGKFLQVRATSSSAGAVTLNKTFSVGSESFTWRLGTESTVAFPLNQWSSDSLWRQTAAGGYGSTDNSKLTLAFQYKLNTISSDNTLVFTNPSNIGRVSVQMLNSTKKIRVTLTNSANSNIMIVNLAATPVDNNTLHTVLMSVDLSQATSSAGLIVYVDGVADNTAASTWSSGGVLNWDGATQGQLGSTFTGLLGYYWLHPGVALDLNDSTIRDKFDAAYIGANGEAPLGGTQPSHFCVGVAATWNSGNPNQGANGAWAKVSGTNLSAADSEVWPPVLTLISSTQTAGPYAIGTPVDFLVQAVGYPKAISNITAASDKGGTWTLNPQSMPAGSNGLTFTFTPSAPGTHSITFTNDGGYTNPAALELVVPASGGGTSQRQGSLAMRIGIGL